MRTVVVLMLLALVATGCSKKSEPIQTPTGTPTLTDSQTPTPTASTPTPSATPQPTVATTTITLKVVGGCRDCLFQAYTTVNGVTKPYGQGQGWLSAPPKWVVPTKFTHNMSFGYTDLPPDDTNGNPTVVVVQYQGVAVGTVLTAAHAQTKKFGSWCWNGTTKKAFTIQVRAATIKVPNTDPTTSGVEPLKDQVLVYASPLIGNGGTFHSTFYGGLGISGTPECP